MARRAALRGNCRGRRRDDGERIRRECRQAEQFAALAQKSFQRAAGGFLAGEELLVQLGSLFLQLLQREHALLGGLQRGGEVRRKGLRIHGRECGATGSSNGDRCPTGDGRGGLLHDGRARRGLRSSDIRAGNRDGEGGLARFRQKREGKDEWIDGEGERIEYESRAEKAEFFPYSRAKPGVSVQLVADVLVELE